MCISFGNPSEPCCKGQSTPLLGEIARPMRPALIDDYAGLSTAQWSVATLGTTYPLTSLYHHFTSPDMLNVGYSAIMTPIRWSVAIPDADGGLFDCWFDDGEEDTDNVGLRFASSISGAEFRVFPGARSRLLPAKAHCEFVDNLGVFDITRLKPSSAAEGASPRQFADTFLQSIAPSIPMWGATPSGGNAADPVEIQARAAQLRINGRKVGELQVDPDPSSINQIIQVSGRVNQQSKVEIDIWYGVGISSGRAVLASPGKGCAVLSLSAADTGSVRRTFRPLHATSVDFGSGFNFKRHAYTVAIAGHSGWTLHNGTNGPHRMVADSTSLESFDGTFSTPWDGTGYCDGIQLDFLRENAQVVLSPGPTMQSLGVSADIVYRPRDVTGDYLRSSTATDYGAVQHAQGGRFNQDGLTSFHVVPWSIGGDEYDGFHGTADAVPSFVPKTILIKRVNK